jgi:hypothetical protein
VRALPLAPRVSGGVAHAIAAGDSVDVGVRASFASAPALTARVNVTVIVTLYPDDLVLFPPEI